MEKGNARKLAFLAAGLGLYGAMRGAKDVKDVVSAPSEAHENRKKAVAEEAKKEEDRKLTADALKDALMAVEERRERHDWEMHNADRAGRKADREAVDEAVEEKVKEKKEAAAQRLLKKLGELVDTMADKVLNRQPFGPPEKHDLYNTEAKDALAKRVVEEALETYGEWDGTNAEPSILHCLRELARFSPGLFEVPKGADAEKLKRGVFAVSAENSKYVDRLGRKLRELRQGTISRTEQSQIDDVQRRLSSATAFHKAVRPFLYPNPEPTAPYIKPRPHGQKTPRNKGTRGGGGRIISI